ncbi:short-chain dehydrogenase [Capsulimonas corticalis]|uniref:Short-chain dehydrogenase n=1 Tax=Capsulimonas corticalis TaxID=2219043 RepID=A0A402CQJ4_9BACT|nr:SDR family oxidoreductase [Capsulimonas corticalis]BDI32671.1 short-chain dehydrogenase [Capsulimonas corticalis]
MLPIDLSGKNALITGGTRGIGRAISQTLASAGASTLALYRSDRAAADESLSVRQWAGPDAAHANIVCDISKESEIAALSGPIRDIMNNRVDLLILSAGIGSRGAWNETSVDDWKHLIDTNLTSAVLLTRLVTPLMPSGGSIVSIASGAGHEGLRGTALYGASKAGLILFTQSLAQEVGPQGIRANVVSPGFTETAFSGKTPSEETKQRVAASTALRRTGKPDDVAGVVLFLCSDLSGFVTAQAIRVNGGIV